MPIQNTVRNKIALSCRRPVVDQGHGMAWEAELFSGLSVLPPKVPWRNEMPLSHTSHEQSEIIHPAPNACINLRTTKRAEVLRDTRSTSEYVQLLTNLLQRRDQYRGCA
jgi:hypothetical protein